MIAPSILSADFSDLGAEIRKIQNVADWIHIDVMDGHFVPNLTIGPVVVSSLRKNTKLPLDCHLMVSEPAKWIEPFHKAGADIITTHIEASDKPEEILKKIKSLGMKAGISLNPDTPFERILPVISHVDLVLIMSVFPGFGGQSFIPTVLDKVRQLNHHPLRKNFLIEIDGGITKDTIHRAAESGVDVFVAGNAVFKSNDPVQAIEELKSLSTKAQK